MKSDQSNLMYIDLEILISGQKYIITIWRDSCLSELVERFAAQHGLSLEISALLY